MTTKTVTDENGAIHHLTRCLGEGGQGQVWLTRGERRVVKVFPRRTDRETLRRQLAFVKRLDLRDLHVARPLSLLRAPDVGYVAEFLSDMVPIRELLRPREKESLLQWYIATGGIRRRLRLLAHAGEALAGLHASGLVYADVSHANVFVSAPVEAEQAWLIDLDNLRYEGEAGSAIYTPGYGAPEIIGGQRFATPMSDAWSFAVMAFQTLSLAHPLLGDMVNDGEPELEEEAFAGRLPWIDHATDTRNRSSNGLPRDWVFGDKLKELVRDTFEEGMTNPERRPSVSKWVDRLHIAADRTLRCRECRGTFLANKKSCPFCDTQRPRSATVRIQRWEPGKGIVEGMGEVAKLPLSDEPLALTRRHTQAESGIAARKTTVVLESRDRGVFVRAVGVPCWVTRPGQTDPSAAFDVTERGRTLPIEANASESWVIHFDRIDTPHRVAVVTGSPAK